MDIYKPETIHEFELEEDVIHWITDDKLDANISIRGIELWWNQYVDYVEMTTTWNYTINTWFKPKIIQIYACYSTRSDFDFSETVVYNTDTLATTGRNKTTSWRINIDNYAIYLTDSWNEIYWTVTSVTDENFIINISYKWSWVDALVEITAFW